MQDKRYAVRAARCRHTAANEEVYETLRRITDPLTRSWEKLAKANRIAIKFNMMMEPNRIHYFAGRRRELVDDAVARAVLRLLRERTSARLVAVDSYGRSQPGVTDAKLNYMPLLDEFEVGYAESNLPLATYEVPGGGGMFKRYTLNACFQDADEVVSVAKMKNHLFIGITLCMKNLFGLPPTVPPEGRVRSYFHHACLPLGGTPGSGSPSLAPDNPTPHPSYSRTASRTFVRMSALRASSRLSQLATISARSLGSPYSSGTLPGCGELS